METVHLLLGFFWRGHIHDLLVGEGARGVSKAIDKTPLDTT